MKRFFATIALLLATSVGSNASLTIEDLPDAVEENNPVCHDGDGMLANCVHGAGIDPLRLAPVVKDGDGNLLGTYAGRSLLTGVDIGDPIPGENFLYALEVVTEEGYRFWVEENGRTVETFFIIYFTGPSCSGDSYVLPTISNRIPMGIVRLVESIQEKWYVPKVDTGGVLGVLSMIGSDGVCVPNPTTLAAGRAVFPNDPAITGVANGIGNYANPYPYPVSVERN